MKRKAFALIVAAALTTILLTACSKDVTETILDESDNNVGRITIENLAESYLNNPCVLEFEENKDGSLNYYEKVIFGKNARYDFAKQHNGRGEDGFETVEDRITSRRENGLTYWYSKRNGITWSIYRDNDDFDKRYEANKRGLPSGLLFEGCHNYLIRKGDGIYQVAPEHYTEYGTLAAKSWGASGVEYIINDAKTLKIVIGEDNSVELSYINYYNDKTIIKIYDIGRNYTPPLALKERIDLMIQNDESYCEWEMP